MEVRSHSNKEKINITLNNLREKALAREIDQLVYKLYDLIMDEIKSVNRELRKILNPIVNKKAELLKVRLLQ